MRLGRGVFLGFYCIGFLFFFWGGEIHDVTPLRQTINKQHSSLPFIHSSFKNINQQKKTQIISKKNTKQQQKKKKKKKKKKKTKKDNTERPERRQINTKT
jgi:hypothetical protein